MSWLCLYAVFCGMRMLIGLFERKTPGEIKICFVYLLRRQTSGRRVKKRRKGEQIDSFLVTRTFSVHIERLKSATNDFYTNFWINSNICLLGLHGSQQTHTETTHKKHIQRTHLTNSVSVSFGITVENCEWHMNRPILSALVFSIAASILKPSAGQRAGDSSICDSLLPFALI